MNSSYCSCWEILIRVSLDDDVHAQNEDAPGFDSLDLVKRQMDIIERVCIQNISNRTAFCSISSARQHSPDNIEIRSAACMRKSDMTTCTAFVKTLRSKIIHEMTQLSNRTDVRNLQERIQFTTKPLSLSTHEFFDQFPNGRRLLLSRYPPSVVARRAFSTDMATPKKSILLCSSVTKAFEVKLTFTLSDPSTDTIRNGILDHVKTYLAEQGRTEHCIIVAEEVEPAVFVSVVCACVYAQPTTCTVIQKALHKAIFKKPAFQRKITLDSVHVVPMTDHAIAEAFPPSPASPSLARYLHYRYSAAVSNHHHDAQFTFDSELILLVEIICLTVHV